MFNDYLLNLFSMPLICAVIATLMIWVVEENERKQ